MIKYIISFAAVGALAVMLAVSASAAPLSPALDIIAKDTEMVVSGRCDAETVFSLDNFRNATGASVKSGIEITAIPDSTDGILMLGTVAVTAGQRLTADSLDRLRFAPTDGTVSAVFSFSIGGDYEYDCIVKLTDRANSAPVISNAVEAWTQTDITCFGELSARDSDGDSIVYELVSYPEKGLISLNRTTGEYKYTPYRSTSGSDSFTYRVRDEYGSYSAVTTATVTVEAKLSDIVFDDMTEHPSANAAIAVYAEGIMTGTVQDGKYLFKPDEAMTKADFLVAVMNALGADNVPTVKSTIFADDGDIAAGAKGYVAAAYSLGIVKGVNEDTGLYFYPNSAITKAEAAVIVNAIVGAKAPDAVPAFADSDAVPAWAKQAIYALNSLGVLTTSRGMISPTETLTRGDTAEIIFALMRKVA